MSVHLISATIQTTEGFSSVWDLEIRQKVVLACGEVSEISSISDSVQEACLVTFKDGRSAEIGLDQVLKVYQHSWQPESAKWRCHPPI